MEDKDVVLSVDRGQGRESNIEISREEIWVHSGKGVTVVDVWITPLDGSESLRVHIVPQDSGLAVVVDRGDKDPQWWRQGFEIKVTEVWRHLG